MPDNEIRERARRWNRVVQSWKYQIALSILWVLFGTAFFVGYLGLHDVFHLILGVAGWTLGVSYVGLAIFQFRKSGRMPDHDAELSTAQKEVP